MNTGLTLMAESHGFHLLPSPDPHGPRTVQAAAIIAQVLLSAQCGIILGGSLGGSVAGRKVAHWDGCA